jgi:hypothetical protein
MHMPTWLVVLLALTAIVVLAILLGVIDVNQIGGGK